MRHLRLPLAILALAAIAACGSGKSSSSAGSNGASSAGSSMGSEAAPASQAMPNCGAVQPVWVNLRTRKYHEPGDSAYGHTKHGEYLCPSAARQQGFVPAGGTGSHRHHKHRNASGASMAGGSQGDDSNP